MPRLGALSSENVAATPPGVDTRKLSTM
jgi:hypothetical protein